MDSEIGCYLRVGVWVKFIKVWALLRFDDFVYLRSGMVKIYDGKFVGFMKRIKITGAGKRVKEFSFFVLEEAWVVYFDWVVVGLEVFGRVFGGDFELVVSVGVSRFGEVFNVVMAYLEAVVWSGEVM